MPLLVPIATVAWSHKGLLLYVTYMRSLLYVTYMRSLFYVTYMRSLFYVTYMRSLFYVTYMRSLLYVTYMRSLFYVTYMRSLLYVTYMRSFSSIGVPDAELGKHTALAKVGSTTATHSRMFRTVVFSKSPPPLPTDSYSHQLYRQHWSTLLRPSLGAGVAHF
jgi:hypothetical protein